MVLTLEQVNNDNDSYLCPAVTIFYIVLTDCWTPKYWTWKNAKVTPGYMMTHVTVIQIQTLQNILMFPEDIFYTQLIHICILVHKFLFEYNSMFLKREPKWSIR
jgi:hypothetical protein